MIKSLYIRNYAIIEELKIDFSRGLTIITGETGAGKSILLGALGLIMGKRADTKSLYYTDKKCIIEGKFDISKYDLKSYFQEHDLDYDDELFIRREITPSGKSRGFVNDSPANLHILQNLSAALIDLHQQFDTLDIHQVSFQLRLIDALANNKFLLAEYQKLFQQYQRDSKTLEVLLRQTKEAAAETDFLNFQLEELSNADLEVGEQETLEEELARLTNAEEIKRTTGNAFQHLSESEHSIIGQLQDLANAITDYKPYHSELAANHDRFDSLILELQDLSQEFERIAEDTEFDPARIQEVQDRLDLIYNLQNKHQVATIKELLEIQEGFESKLQTFDDLSEEITKLETSLKNQQKSLEEIAVSLRERRLNVIPSFEQSVQKGLVQLSMNHAQLKAELTALDELSTTGKDEINFMFAANKGSRLQLIKDVASGGELSRLTLITKSLVASAIPLPTLIFDEIDTGISGDVALKMGDILRKLSDEHQVVSITHSPQIASKADTHYFVYKQVKGDRTFTNVKPLSKKERIHSIAVMLSSNPPSDSAIENARELIEAN